MKSGLGRSLRLFAEVDLTTELAKPEGGPPLLQAAHWFDWLGV